MHEQFVTASYLYLDVPERRAVYSSAGHPPLPVWRHKEQQVYEYDETGLVLGISPDIEYSNTVLSLEAGDRILLYTDGILEATKGPQFFGKDRFKHFVASDPHLPADEFCGSFLARL